MTDKQSIWVFGYGSLIWRPDFEFVGKRVAQLGGYQRRFWQGSTDHRGVPEAPGRVVTLLAGSAEDECWGVAYQIAGQAAREIIDALDYRERGGYVLRMEILRDRNGEQFESLVYIATPANPNYLGPASDEAIARQIIPSVGPSGANLEYLLELAQALRDHAIDDPHVFALERAALSQLAAMRQ